MTTSHFPIKRVEKGGGGGVSIVNVRLKKEIKLNHTPKILVVVFYRGN